MTSVELSPVLPHVGMVEGLLLQVQLLLLLLQQLLLLLLLLF